MNENYACYILKSTDPAYKNHSYNGSTNNLTRRLRQHNGEIVGGAFRTHNGRPWIFCAYLTGLPTHVNALSCEWRIRYPDNKRKKEAKYKGVVGRIVGLNEVLKLEKWTSKCVENNRDMKLNLYILEEYRHLIDDQIPDNITVNIIL